MGYIFRDTRKCFTCTEKPYTCVWSFDIYFILLIETFRRGAIDACQKAYVIMISADTIAPNRHQAISNQHTVSTVISVTWHYAARCVLQPSNKNHIRGMWWGQRSFDYIRHTHTHIYIYIYIYWYICYIYRQYVECWVFSMMGTYQ